MATFMSLTAGIIKFNVFLCADFVLFSSSCSHTKGYYDLKNMDDIVQRESTVLRRCINAQFCDYLKEIIH